MNMHKEKNHFVQQRGGMACQAKISDWKIQDPSENS